MWPKTGDSNALCLVYGVSKILLQLARSIAHNRLSSDSIDANGFVHIIAKAQTNAHHTENCGYGRRHQIFHSQ